jgi:hypothetical protein
MVLRNYIRNEEMKPLINTKYGDLEQASEI